MLENVPQVVLSVCSRVATSIFLDFLLNWELWRCLFDWFSDVFIIDLSRWRFPLYFVLCTVLLLFLFLVSWIDQSTWKRNFYKEKIFIFLHARCRCFRIWAFEYIEIANLFALHANCVPYIDLMIHFIWFLWFVWIQ